MPLLFSIKNASNARGNATRSWPCFHFRHMHSEYEKGGGISEKKRNGEKNQKASSPTNPGGFATKTFDSFSFGRITA